MAGGKQTGSGLEDGYVELGKGLKDYIGGSWGGSRQDNNMDGLSEGRCS